MPDSRRRIDVHFHAVPEAFKHAASAAGRGATIASGFPEWSNEAALALMDRTGIETAVTSISQPGVHFGDDAQARGLARLCNEDAAARMQRWPTRFGAFATLPLPDVDGACAEIAYALDVLRLDGVCLLASYGERFIGDAQFEPVLQELHARGAVVFLHPNFHPSSRGLGWSLPAFLTEFPFDTTRAAAQLVFSGATRRYSNIRFILAHAGGTLPYLAWRLSLAPMIDRRFADRSGEDILGRSPPLLVRHRAGRRRAGAGGLERGGRSRAGAVRQRLALLSGVRRRGHGRRGDRRAERLAPDGRGDRPAPCAGTVSSAEVGRRARIRPAYPADNAHRLATPAPLATLGLDDRHTLD